MIERTYDTELVRDMLSDPVLNKRVTQDGDVSMFDPENQKDLIFLLAINDAGQSLGFYVVHIINSPICYQLHANFLPKYWGTGLHKYSTQAFRWMFEHTNAEKIVAFCPEIYPEVIQHAVNAGMIKEGVLTKSSIYDDKLCDNHIMAITRARQCS